MAYDKDTVTLDGIDLTGAWSNGVTVKTLALGGWSGSPGSSLQLTQKPRSPGSWPSPRQLKERVLTPSGLLTAPDRDTLRMALNTLASAAAIDPVTLSVTEGSLTRTLQVMRQDELVATVGATTYAEWSMQLVAPDPRKLGTPRSTSTGLPSSTGGFTYPHTYPFSINATVSTGQCSATNPGNTTGPVKLRIDGPCTGPVVTHAGTGAQLVFASSLSVGSSQWLDIDMEAQTVLLNGQASRAGYITQRGWFGFEPGGNTWTFAAASGFGPLLTVTVTPAWL